MAIRVKDILTLRSTKQFAPVAGTDGFFRTIEMVDMLDYAWERSEDYGISLFDRNSFVLSSLLFARDDSEKLYTVIQSLIDCGVSGLAYKPIFYNDLPEMVCNLANSCNFPIFCIRNGTDIDYREIIIDITDAIRLDRNVTKKESYLTRMAIDILTPEEVTILAQRVSPGFEKNAVATLIYNLGDLQFSKEDIIFQFMKFEEFKNTCVLHKFEKGLILIITHKSSEHKIFEHLFDRVLTMCNLNDQFLTIAHSGIHPTATMLNYCIREAKVTYTSCLVMDRKELWYEQIGVLSCLIPLSDSVYLETYMKRFLNPILDNEEYMQTAIAFIRAEGNYEVAAQYLNYHKNTLRYRLNKIQTWLAPSESYDYFYQNLSVSIKIFLIKKYTF